MSKLLGRTFRPEEFQPGAPVVDRTEPRFSFMWPMEMVMLLTGAAGPRVVGVEAATGCARHTSVSARSAWDFIHAV